MITSNHALSIRRQCDLLVLNRSSCFYERVLRDDTELANLICDVYKTYPMYGYRRITALLRRDGMMVNHKRVLRLMREMGLKAIYPPPKTTVCDSSHKKYPYLLKGLAMTRPHQVWQIDITYLRTHHGFMYLTALIDVYSRYVVGWTLSNTLESSHCLAALEKATGIYGLAEIINSDQGSQFTSHEWVDALESKGIFISMSGRGRSNDNAHIERLWRTLKYEWTLINGARSVGDYKRLLPQFIDWYNNLRPHQSLRYQTPSEVLKSKTCGYMDKAFALTHITTSATTTITKNSLILRD